MPETERKVFTKAPSGVNEAGEISYPTMVSPHYITSLPILVLFPHSRCNCRCVMCDIWRIRQVREITPDDLRPHLESIRSLRVQWVVLSGGEPLMHSDLATLAKLLRGEGIRVTLLTAGLTLKQHAALVADSFDDVTISLDGPPAIHDRIRAVPRAFERLNNGVQALRKLRPFIPVSARSTVQKANHKFLRETVATAKSMGLNSISFLAVDAASTAFNRPDGWTPEQQHSVRLEASEIDELACEIAALIREYADDIASGYIAESPEKLNRIVQHFRAELGEITPTAPVCNAPWVSAVIEADGSLRPCFFHPSLGSIHGKSLLEVLNSEDAVRFRQELDIASHPTCQRCVCSLHLSKEKAMGLRSENPQKIPLEQASPSK